MADTLNIEDRTGEKNLVFRRMLVAMLLVFLMVIALVARLFYLQVVLHDHYVTKSTDNRVQVQPLTPTRGLIYDRNGVLLADNLPSHNLQLVMERVENLADTLQQLRSLIEISEWEEERFETRLKRSRRPFQPVVLKEQLTETEIARIAANRYFLDGVEIDATLIRRYPYESTFAHVLGYVGKINESELRKIDSSHYAGTFQIGKNGLEKTYEQDLLGEPGARMVETNAKGRILRTLENEASRPGVDLKLYLDLELQQLAEQELEGKRGAIVAIDPKTGGILALTSNPSFNPNLFVTGISTEDYAVLRDSKDVPFLNRATRGLYPPASTIKMFLGLGALESGVTTWDYKVPDPGYYILPNDEDVRKRDWKEGGHKDFVTLSDAIIESCDTYFYDLSFRMKLENMNDALDKFGFGRDTTKDVHNVRKGINPNREWKKQRYGLSWFAGDSLNIGIGQGYILASPLQVAIATMTLVNDGQWKVASLVQDTSKKLKIQLETNLPKSMELSDEHWQKMKDAMRGVVHSSKGTARGTGYDSPFQIAGKTGTAQVFSVAQDETYEAEDIEERLRDHAWFTGFAPFEDPEIVVTVFVENGEHGSAMGRIARRIMENWILREQK